MANFQSKEFNPWNPFLSTSRDLDRTDELSQKNSVFACILSLLFVPLAMVYLNRGVNSLKIAGYVFVCAFMFALVADSEEQSAGVSEVIGYAGGIAITVENVNTVHNARKRKNS
ncbi:MAG: hypothetical protein RLZZ04_2106 [Cyanobacteriota bacterium]|jgi:drug/metabolite transporter (DMT)-like permease